MIVEAQFGSVLGWCYLLIFGRGETVEGGSNGYCVDVERVGAGRGKGD